MLKKRVSGTCLQLLRDIINEWPISCRNGLLIQSFGLFERHSNLSWSDRLNKWDSVANKNGICLKYTRTSTCSKRKFHPFFLFEIIAFHCRA